MRAPRVTGPHLLFGSVAKFNGCVRLSQIQRDGLLSGAFNICGFGALFESLRFMDRNLDRGLQGRVITFYVTESYAHSLHSPAGPSVGTKTQPGLNVRRSG